MGVLMFRYWAGATAGVLIGSLGFSGVFAEGLGSKVTPLAGSQSSTAYLFADANFSSRSSASNIWDRASGMVLSKTGDSAAASQTFAFVDFAPASPFTAAWSPVNFVANATSVQSLPFSDSRTSVDVYFGVFESLSKQRMNGTQRGGDSTTRSMP